MRSSLLEFIVAPEDGLVTLVSGETFCGVRMSDRVFLRPDPANDGVVETVIAEPRQFVPKPDGC